jgi:ketosteroid isomerase-like protein
VTSAYSSAMGRGDVETVGRLYNACWAAGDLDLVRELLHPDVVWTAIESAPDSGTRRGHEGARAYMNDWLESFDLQAMPVEPLGTAPDGRLVCALHGIGSERRSGVTLDIRYGGVFRFAEDGRILEIHEYATSDDARTAAGLTE